MPAAGSDLSTIAVEALAEGLDRSASRSNNYLEGMNISLKASGRRGRWSGGLDAPQERLNGVVHAAGLAGGVVGDRQDLMRLPAGFPRRAVHALDVGHHGVGAARGMVDVAGDVVGGRGLLLHRGGDRRRRLLDAIAVSPATGRSEEHTSELPSLMRI